MVTKYTRVRFEPQRSVAALLMAGAALALTMGLATVIGQGGQPVDLTQNVVDAPAPVAGAVFGSGPALKPGDGICPTAFQRPANGETGCEKDGPSNEKSIAVTPIDEINPIGDA